MKTQTIYFFFIAFTIICCNSKIFAQNEDLIGKWTLISIKTDTGMIKVPDTDLLNLTISDEELKFNLDINSCWTEYSLKESKIIFETVACTEVCCDRNYGRLINYSGNFKIENQKLKILNDKGQYNFKRNE